MVSALMNTSGIPGRDTLPFARIVNVHKQAIEWLPLGHMHCVYDELRLGRPAAVRIEHYRHCEIRDYEKLHFFASVFEVPHRARCVAHRRPH